MKTFKNLLFLFIFMMFTTTLYAQDKNRGIKVGYQVSSIILVDAGEDLFDNPYHAFYVGVFTDKDLIPLLKLMSGIEFYQIGNRQDDDNKTVVNYLDIPVGLKLKLGPIYAIGGVNGAIKLSAREWVNGEKNSVSGRFTTFDAGAFVGVGFNILFVGIEVKYDWGLVDINKSDAMVSKTRYLQAGLTLGF